MNAPGLPSLNESKQQRRRRLTSGKAAIGGIPPRLFLVGLTILIVGGFLYFRSAQAELEAQRGGIMAKQRAVAQELAPRLIPLRDGIEKGVAQLLDHRGKEDFRSEGVDFEKLFRTPGIYLRVRAFAAADTVTLRKAAMESLRDGFTSCLISDPRAPSPTAGKACVDSQACQPGEICSEYGVCGRPSSPFNARLLYRALGVLSEQWTSEVREAKTELALLAYERGLDSVTQVDIPVAIDVYQRAKYSVVVLDEEPKSGLPPHIDDDKLETEMERLQRVPHPALVGVFSVPEGAPLALLRAEAAGSLRDVGRPVTRSPEAEAARSRQANSCAMALGVRNALYSGGEGPRGEEGARSPGGPPEPAAP